MVTTQVNLTIFDHQSKNVI